ncbi:hypothetical protein LB503_001810 [Fusarium chuoi]|nr:hypothetical protein LB503_001810 [Fusarium chuoi]
MSSYASATEESNVSRNPIDIEIDRSHTGRRRRPASPLIPSETYNVNASDISAIPSDSFLDGDAKGDSPSATREMVAAAGAEPEESKQRQVKGVRIKVVEGKVDSREEASAKEQDQQRFREDGGAY